MQVWRLDAVDHTLVFASADHTMPYVVYWGATLPDHENLETLAASQQHALTGASLDVLAPLSLSPERAHLFQGQAGLHIGNADGTIRLEPFTLATTDATHDRIVFDLTRGAYGLRLTIDVIDNMFALQTTFTSDEPVLVHWLAAPVLPAAQSSEKLIEFSGKWCAEFQTTSFDWAAGARLRDNPTGRTGHEHFPALLSASHGANNAQGEVFSWHYGWSGGHKMIAEELQDGRRQVQFGHATDGVGKPVTQCSTAVLYANYSGAGLNGLRRTHQGFVRDHIVDMPRIGARAPVHYNCWEAIYFDHNFDTLCDIATKAAALGAERFVLDDGWFKGRDDDTTSLGDWYIDARKFPDGLGPLIDHVHAAGMGFGIWFEPEMVNPDSDLFRAHPDWVMGPADQVLGRGQLVLDMTKPDVRTYLADKIAAILASYEIEYVKWDHNRVLPYTDAAATQGSYALFDQLNARFPNVVFESCSSGGGRIDYEILKRTQRVWLSDSNDAYSRFAMQNTASLFLPSIVTGSHVGPRTCHTTGRIVPMALRAWVAASRHMGFEMDPRELDAAERATLTAATQWYKDNRDWMQSGSVLALDCDDPALMGELQIAADDSQFVAFVIHNQVSTQSLQRPVRLVGLEADTTYEINLVNPDDGEQLPRLKAALSSGPLRLSGQTLMRQGIQLPIGFPTTIWVIEGRKL